MTRIYLFFLFCFLTIHASSQVIIKGELLDFGNDKPVENANIRNVFTLKGMTTKENGLFQIEVKKGELLEISKLGYQTLRIRIHSEKEPLYYKLVLKKAPIELREVDIKGRTLDFKKDSMRYRETYDIVMRKEHKEDVDMRSMPLAMLSKKNREEWAFQKMYEEWEREKYIDFTFNERLVNKITYLEGEELKQFMKTFRPSYEFLRSASQYEYLEYIKRCYYLYKKRMEK
ncbi:MAG: carboxypeptidase-like regulatory domain-containing protein [Chitinophagaceae bacterium]|nr:carboxypeptidase-like regulatory domain-containing protein [Chitinophagaceae bacterium]